MTIEYVSRHWFKAKKGILIIRQRLALTGDTRLIKRNKACESSRDWKNTSNFSEIYKKSYYKTL